MVELSLRWIDHIVHWAQSLSSPTASRSTQFGRGSTASAISALLFQALGLMGAVEDRLGGDPLKVTRAKTSIEDKAARPLTAIEGARPAAREPPQLRRRAIVAVFFLNVALPWSDPGTGTVAHLHGT